MGFAHEGELSSQILLMVPKFIVFSCHTHLQEWFDFVPLHARFISKSATLRRPSWHLWRYHSCNGLPSDVICPTWSRVSGTAILLSVSLVARRYEASCQATVLWIEFKTLYTLRLPLDRAFSARLVQSSRTAAMRRFPDFPGWGIAVDYRVVSSWKESSERWRW